MWPVIEFAAQYIAGCVAVDGRHADTAVVKIDAGNEVPMFTQWFLGWDWDYTEKHRYVDPLGWLGWDDESDLQLADQMTEGMSRGGAKARKRDKGKKEASWKVLLDKATELADKVGLVQNMNGNIMTPWVAFIQMQTSKTMPLRVKKQSDTAMKIAQFLETHPKVTKVMYPGLKSFPQKELADRYHRNGLHGGMLWFDEIGRASCRERV